MEELKGYKSSIDESDLEFMMISSRESIYSYPIQTMVQEYINNAKDANREAGVPDNKMIIHVPTYEEPYFSVKDFGVGLDKDGIVNVYRKMYRSTKRDKNHDISKKQAGKYGVGAKIAFLYTDAFQIITRKNGYKWCCFAHKANTQLGEYDFYEEAVATDEPNGVEVVIQLTQPDHIDEFVYAIQRMFFLWKEKPEFNVELKWPYSAFENQNMKYFSNYPDELSSLNVQNGIFLDVDGTPYDVTSYYEKISGTIKIDLWFYRTVFIKASLSEVFIPMNRERVQEDDKLLEFFKGLPNKFRESVDELIKENTQKTDFQNISELYAQFKNMRSIISYNKRIDYYVSKIDRRFTFQEGSLYMEQKPDDKFRSKTLFPKVKTDKNRRRGWRSRPSYDPKNYPPNSILEKSIVADKYMREISYKIQEPVTIYTSKIPTDMIEFFKSDVDMVGNIKSTKIEAKTERVRTSSNIKYYNIHGIYNDVSRESFVESNTDKEIYYMDCEYNCFSYSAMDRYEKLLIEEMKVLNKKLIAVSNTQKKNIESLGYTLTKFSIDTHKFSEQVMDTLSIPTVGSAFYFKNFRGLRALDKDVETACLMKSVDWRLPDSLEAIVNKNRQAINDKYNSILKSKYPFICGDTTEKDLWACSYLRQLSSLGINKLEEPTTDLTSLEKLINQSMMQ